MYGYFPVIGGNKVVFLIVLAIESGEVRLSCGDDECNIDIFVKFDGDNRSNVQVFSVNTLHRASQGVATDDRYMYLTTSLNEKGQRENIISVYTLDGKFLKEKRNASSELDRDGRFMDFGDATVVDEYLYVALYNWNSLPEIKMPLYSKIAVFDTRNLSLLALYDIGGNSVEAVTYSGGHFWTAFHDKPIIKEFDANFKFMNSFPLEIPSSIKISDGYIEGMIWYGNDILLNIHGPNVECSFYSPGLLRDHYNGSQFKFNETVIPPTFGSGQGLSINHDSFYFVDRPWNAIIKADLVATQSQFSVDDNTVMTSENKAKMILANSSISLKVRNDTQATDYGRLKDTVISFLNLHSGITMTSDCEDARVKTTISNEINDEIQYLEGSETANAIVGVEITKALKSLVSSDGTIETVSVTIKLSSSCER